MPRPIRTFSELNIYHIVLKSINSQVIFEHDKDFEYFLKEFSDTCIEHNVKIYAYCVMSNHIHLLLKFPDSELSVLFKSFGAKYVPKYNYVHNRTGSLFRGRYYSKPINDDEYLLSVVKYIHFNPVKAGICAQPSDYLWSSFREYSGGKEYVDTSFVYGIISEKQFLELHENEDDMIQQFLIENEIFNKTYDELSEAAERLLGKCSFDETVNVLKKAGVSKSSIAKLLKVDKRKLK